jgi:hypothetical protein
MLFNITDVTRFKATAKQAITLANNKMNSSLEQCVEVTVTDGDLLTFTAINSSYGVKFNMPLEGTNNVDGTCLIHHTKLSLLLSKIPAKTNYLKVSLANNILNFSLLNLGSIGESIWVDNVSFISSDFLNEAKYNVLDEDNTTFVPHLIAVSDIAKSCDSSVIGIKGDSKELCVSGKFGTTGNNLFMSKLDSIGNITFAIKPTLLTNILSFLGPSITVGYNSNNKWLMFASDKGVVCYKSLNSITNIEKTINNIFALDAGGCLTVKRSELDLAINFHTEGDYINLTSDKTNTMLQVFSSSSKEPAKLKPELYDGGFVDVSLEVNHLKQALQLTNNSCVGITINQRVTVVKGFEDTDIVILVINSPDSGAIETTTIVYTSVK